MADDSKIPALLLRRGRVKIANQAARALWGRELKGQAAAELVDPTSRTKLAAALAHPEPMLCELQLARPGAYATPLLLLLVPMAPACHLLLASSDAPSEQTQMAASLFTLNAQLANVTHDLARRSWEAETASRRLEQERHFVTMIFNTAPTPILVTEVDGNIVRCNPECERVLGIPLAQLRGRALWETSTLQPEELRDLAAAFRAVGETGRQRELETAIVGPDGQKRRIAWTIAAQRGDHGRPLLLVATGLDITECRRLEIDITKHQQTEEALRDSESRLRTLVEQVRESEERFRLALDEAPIGMALVAMDGRFLRINSALCQLVGYPADELRELTIRALTHPDDRDTDRSEARRLVSGEISRYHAGKRFLCKKGTTVEVMLSASMVRSHEGVPQYYIIQIEDINERKRQEKKQLFLAEAGAVLASSLDYQQTLASIAQLTVHHLADLCVIDMLDEKNQVQRVTVAHADPAKAAACTELAHTSLDWLGILGWSVLELKEPLLRSDLRPDLIAAKVQDPKQLQLLQALDPRSAIVVPMRARGRVLGALALLSCSPDRYRTEDLSLAEELALRAALAIDNAILYQAAQRAAQARDEVLGVVAHDLRNPLNGITLAAQVLLSNLTDGEIDKNRKRVQVILRSVGRANRLISDLLDVTRMEAGQLRIEPSRFPARQLVEDALDEQQPLALAANLELRLTVEHELPEIWADRTRLLQVFENLIGNAVKFTAPGGHITIGAAPQAAEVHFWVADTGVGIPAENLPHVFDRFWFANNAAHPGTGLGLAIAKSIVQAHGGRIWVTSTPGCGTTFFFTVPTSPG